MIAYVHRYSHNAGCWTVGFFYPDGRWDQLSYHDTEQAAADEAARMNGHPAPVHRVRAIYDALVAMTCEELARMNDAELRALRANLAGLLALAELEEFERQEGLAGLEDFERELASHRVDGCRSGLPDGEEG